VLMRNIERWKAQRSQPQQPSQQPVSTPKQ
jgi:polar amino acid transport system substrate-binding protein